MHNGIEKGNKKKYSKNCWRGFPNFLGFSAFSPKVTIWVCTNALDVTGQWGRNESYFITLVQKYLV